MAIPPLGGGSLLNLAPPPAPVIDPVRVNVPFLERNPSQGPVSPRANFKDSSTTYQIAGQCPWPAWPDAMQDFLGYPIVSPLTNGGRYLSRYLPQSIPWLQSLDPFEAPRPYLYCTDLALDGGGDSPDSGYWGPAYVRDPLDVPPNGAWADPWGSNCYGTAFLTANFETLTYDCYLDTEMVALGYVDNCGNPDESSLRRYVTILPGPSTKYQTLPSGSFTIVNPDPLPPGLTMPAVNIAVPGTPGRLELEIDLSITWHAVPRAAVGLRVTNWYMANTLATGVPYRSPIEECLGCVNLYPFAGYRKGTLLLVAVVVKPTRSPLGMRLFDLEYRFKLFEARSKFQLSPAGGAPGYAYGHNLVLYIGQPPANNPTGPGSISAGACGYYETVGGQAAVGLGPVTSNYLLESPLDHVNLFNYKDMSVLFQVPQLRGDNGNL